MNALIDPTLLPALEAVESALEGRKPRRYASDPLAPTEAEQRDSDHVEPPDAEQTFWAQQCPSDASFR